MNRKQWRGVRRKECTKEDWATKKSMMKQEKNKMY